MQGKLAEEYNTVLGIPFLKKYHAVINCENNTVVLKVTGEIHFKEIIESKRATPSQSKNCLASKNVNIKNSHNGVNSLNIECNCK